MVDINFKTFYTQYAYDYHLYKVSTLSSILENSAKFEKSYLRKKITGYDDSDYTRFLKAEIRMTCFHAIETLFELIFALEPVAGRCRDFEILKAISTSKFADNYSRINQISKDDAALSFLDLPVPELGKHPLWIHIFFFHPPSNDPKASEIINDSNDAIRLFLKEIAKTFSDRNEYNAYKHGIRALNAFTEFGILNTDGTNEQKFDLSDSISYFTVEKEKGKVTHEVIHTKLFNTEKDIKMISLVSALIRNIIQRRRWVMVPEDRPETLTSTNFPKDDVIDMIKTRPGSQSFVMQDITFRTSVGINPG